MQLAFSFIIGSCLGSFINVLVWRLPRNESIIIPRSYCPKCRKQIKWYENIPLFSWMLLKACCSNCQTKISIRYPFVEFLCAGLFVICCFCSPTLYADFSGQYKLIAGYILVFFLLSISIIDIYHLWIPRSLCKAGVVAGISFNAFIGFIADNNLFFVLNSFISMLLGYLLFELLRKTASHIYKKPALGHGDSMLSALIGSWLGIKGLGLSWVLAFLIAGIFALLGLLSKKLKRGDPMPLGPFLSLGCFLIWIFGNEFWINNLFIR